MLVIFNEFINTLQFEGLKNETKLTVKVIAWKCGEKKKDYLHWDAVVAKAEKRVFVQDISSQILPSSSACQSLSYL